MGMIDVYKADVHIGPNIMGDLYSYRPIPSCTYPAFESGVGEFAVQIMGCSRFVIEVPDNLALDTDSNGMDAIPDPERSDGFIRLGPRVILDRTHQTLYEKDYHIRKIYWRYWETREIVGRMEAEARASPGRAGDDATPGP